MSLGELVWHAACTWILVAMLDWPGSPMTLFDVCKHVNRSWISIQLMLVVSVDVFIRCLVWKLHQVLLYLALIILVTVMTGRDFSGPLWHKVIHKIAHSGLPFTYHSESCWLLLWKPAIMWQKVHWNREVCTWTWTVLCCKHLIVLSIRNYWFGYTKKCKYGMLK